MVLGTPPGRGVVLVVGPTWEPRDSDVALNVATAIRDAGGSVALVSIEDGSAELTVLGARGEVTPADRASESAELAAATRADLRQSVERLKGDTDVVVVDAADPLAEAVLPDATRHFSSSR